jgi:nucleoside-diphosphate-sugar epimerase
LSELQGKHLFIVGCGYVGRAVAAAAASEGARVTALTRNPETAAALRAAAVAVVVADLASDAWHCQCAEAPDLLLNCVSSGGGGLEAYRRSYGDGMASLAAWAARVGPVATAVYTSSTSVYPQGDGQTVDEDAATGGGGERAGILLQAEATMQGAANAWRRWFILRLAGIYGPGRHHLLDQVANGEVAGEGEHRLNLIHRDDAVAAILACLGAPAAVGSAVFNVADDGAARKAEVAGWLAARAGLPAPRFAGVAGSLRRPVVPDRVILSARLRAKLGWRPKYPTYREGYGSFLSR